MRRGVHGRIADGVRPPGRLVRTVDCFTGGHGQATSAAVSRLDVRRRVGRGSRCARRRFRVVSRDCGTGLTSWSPPTSASPPYRVRPRHSASPRAMSPGTQLPRRRPAPAWRAPPSRPRGRDTAGSARLRRLSRPAAGLPPRAPDRRRPRDSDQHRAPTPATWKGERPRKPIQPNLCYAAGSLPGALPRWFRGAFRTAVALRSLAVRAGRTILAPGPPGHLVRPRAGRTAGTVRAAAARRAHRRPPALRPGGQRRETWRIVQPLLDHPPVPAGIIGTRRRGNPGPRSPPLAAAMAARGPLSPRTAEPEGCYGGSARM